MQLFAVPSRAACAQAGRASDRRLRYRDPGSSPRPPHRRWCPGAASPRTSSRSRGTCAASPTTVPMSSRRARPVRGGRRGHHAEPTLSPFREDPTVLGRSAVAVHPRRRRPGLLVRSEWWRTTAAPTTWPARGCSPCPRRCAVPGASRCRWSTHGHELPSPPARRPRAWGSSATTSSTSSCTAGWSTTARWSRSSASGRAAREALRRLQCGRGLHRPAIAALRPDAIAAIRGGRARRHPPGPRRRASSGVSP